MEDKKKLTLTQGKVLKFLRNFLREKGYPPTLREIASYFRLKGPRAPQKTLNILERKGYLRRVSKVSRGIEILGGPSLLPALERHTLSVPIAGRVKAGEPILAIENIEGYINLDQSLVGSENVFLLRVQGDSMIEAHIQDGDFALVKPQPNAEVPYSTPL